MSGAYATDVAADQRRGGGHRSLIARGAAHRGAARLGHDHRRPAVSAAGARRSRSGRLPNIPADPAQAGRPWRDIRPTSSSATGQMRTVAIVGVRHGHLTSAPMNTLLVPITDDLRQAPLLAAAGLLSAAIGLGRRLFRPSWSIGCPAWPEPSLSASVLTDIGAGVVLCWLRRHLGPVDGPNRAAGLVPDRSGLRRHSGSPGERSTSARRQRSGSGPTIRPQALAALFLVSCPGGAAGVMMCGHSDRCHIHNRRRDRRGYRHYRHRRGASRYRRSPRPRLARRRLKVLLPASRPPWPGWRHARTRHRFTPAVAGTRTLGPPRRRPSGCCGGQGHFILVEMK